MITSSGWNIVANRGADDGCDHLTNKSDSIRAVKQLKSGGGGSGGRTDVVKVWVSLKRVKKCSS